MIYNAGDFPTSATVYIPINTFDSNDPTASVTATNLVNTDVHIHKDGGTTQRNNAAGITMTIDYDSITGNHLLIIDTSNNTVADFYQAGHEYQVRVEGVTVDGATINAWVGAFSIERAGGALALIKNGTYGLSALNALLAHADYGLAKLVRSTTPANTLTVDAAHNVGLIRPAGTIVDDAGNSTTVFKTNLTSAEDDYIKDAYIKFTSGADINQVKKISAYNGTSKVITTAAFTDEPAENDTFVIINE